jgi:hypothetical protein
MPTPVASADGTPASAARPRALLARRHDRRGKFHASAGFIQAAAAHFGKPREPCRHVTIGKRDAHHGGMPIRSRYRGAINGAAGAVALAAGGYACWAALAWLHYGRAVTGDIGSVDPLLDEVMPVYEVAERHQIHIAAPAEVTFAAACEQDLMALPLVRAIFKGREILLGGTPDTAARPRGLLAVTQSLGWGVLGEVPGREIVMGAVTQPWLANVVFRALQPGEFAAFHEPDYVKIAWTLRADVAGPHQSVFRTETRVATTDAAARAKFRWYWARFSPGIRLIRSLSLGPVRREAERRSRPAPG